MMEASKEEANVEFERCVCVYVIIMLCKHAQP